MNNLFCRLSPFVEIWISISSFQGKENRFGFYFATV